MNADAKLSIIVPIYNGEKYIKSTIRCLLSSSYPNLELLLVDDGSTDSSLEICNKYAESDPRIKTYHKNNGGIAEARNYGLSHATGNYIAFCDQDDEVSDEMYQKMMDRIINDGSQAAICGCCRKKADGNTIIYEQYTDTVYKNQDIRQSLLLPMLFKGFKDYGNKEINIYPTIWKCIISKQLIDEKQLAFCSFIDHEDDLLMMVQLFLNAEKISTLSDVLYYWNTNTASETYRRRGRYIDDLEIKQQKFMSYIVKELRNHGIRNTVIDKYLYVLHCRNALQILDNVGLSNEDHRSKWKEIRRNKNILYIQSAQNTVSPKKGFVRNSVIIPMLRKKLIVSAYFLNQLINYVRFFVEKYHAAETLERKIKSPSSLS